MPINAKKCANKYQIKSTSCPTNAPALRKRPVDHSPRVQDQETLDCVTNCLRDPGLSLNHEHQDLQLVRPSSHEALIGVVGHLARQQRLVQLRPDVSCL